MHSAKGQVLELILEDGNRYLRIVCPPNLVPAAGQYLLASDGSGSPIPAPLFHTDSSPDGFLAAASSAVGWTPGTELYLRGPLGHGFSLPLAARRVALVAWDNSPARLRGLIRPALKQDAGVVLVCESAPEHLPDDVEVQPLSMLGDILEWADYAAFDIGREDLHLLRDRLGKQRQRLAAIGAQVLINTPVPCGGIAECGVCAVAMRSEWKLACKDGPVFDWAEI